MLPCTEPRDCSRQVIGYSDSRDFAVGVGPKPAGPAEGLFANLVQPVIVRKPSAADAADPVSPTKDEAKAAPSAPTTGKKAGVQGTEPKNRTPIVQPLAGRRALLYDWLPPAKGEKREGAVVPSEASKAYQVSLKERVTAGEEKYESESLGVLSEASKSYQARLQEKGDVGDVQEASEGSMEKPTSVAHTTEEDMFAEAGGHG